MEDQKFYWSSENNLENWTDDTDFMTFVLIPRKWWSIKAWKLANSMRAEFLKRAMRWEVPRG
jgi:hypothetical protein